jgi:glycosyltransferase involved in cell wall biosynthesis
VADLIRYSIIIPCYNEAGSIGPVLGEIVKQVPDAEHIVIDDGSTDETARIVEKIKQVRLVKLGVNSGKGVALRKGIEEAAGEVIVFIDADGQDDPADLPLLLDQVEQGHPFVNGSKFIGTIEEGGISRPNFYGNLFMSGLINLLFGSWITDSQSGFRAIEKKYADRWNLISTEYEIETEMLCKALKSGLRVQEVAVTRKARTAGSTGFKRVRNGLRVLGMILKERFTR